ncbi:hypothetical protein ACA910_005514 [Epithemia clementina (nom. ined.)]
MSQPSSRAQSDQEPHIKRQKAEEAIEFIGAEQEISVKTASMENEERQDEVAGGNISATSKLGAYSYTSQVASHKSIEDVLHGQVEVIGEGGAYRKSAEYVLDGQVEAIGGGEDGINEVHLANTRFAEGVGHVDCRPPYCKDERREDICFLMGPRGSGKTFYALKGLSRIESTWMSDEIERCFTMYYKITNKSDLEASDGSHEFSTCKIEEAIKTKLTAKVGKVQRQLDMRISLILDDATTAGDHVAELRNLCKIYKILHDLCRLPRLIVVTTGIDKFNFCMGSGTAFPKFRMGQWCLSSFQRALPKWLPALSSNECEKLTRIVESEPMYQRLLTNPRAAYFLAHAVATYLDEDYVQQYMPTVTLNVVTKYIEASGFCDLDSSSRRRVARAIFKLLDDTSKVVDEWHRNLEWPMFATSESNWELDDREFTMATSLIDYNVEREYGEVTLVQGNHTVDISPAVTIVLFFLIDVLGDLLSNWSGFEILIAMIELHHLVVKQTGRDFTVRLIKLKKPFPPTVYRENLDVPILDKDYVYLNGADAPFGDVLSFGRFCRAKHETNAEQLELDLQDELSKMGLVNGNSNNNKACVAITALMREWQKGSSHSMNEFAAQGQTPQKEKDIFDQARAEGALLQNKIIEFNTNKEFSFSEENSRVTLSHGSTTYTSEDPLPSRVDAVFYTNACEFKIKGIKGMEGAEAMIISPSDLVNHLGDLDSEMDQWVKQQIEGLRDGVFIRFVFVSQAFRG